MSAPARRESGQALVLVVAALCLVLAGALVLGSFARALGDRGHAQRAADLGALAGAKAMRSRLLSTIARCRAPRATIASTFATGSAVSAQGAVTRWA